MAWAPPNWGVWGAAATSLVQCNKCDPEIKEQLLSDVEDLFDRCLQLYDNTTSNALCDPLKDCPPETDLGREDSVSQVASCQGAISTTSCKLLARQIDFDRWRAELQAFHAGDLARAKADAAAAAEADAEARLRIGKVVLSHPVSQNYRHS